MDSEPTIEELLEASRYPVFLRWSDADQLFLATLPDLEGLTVHGATPEEAIAEAKAAALDWLYGMRQIGADIPEPSSVAVHW